MPICASCGRAIDGAFAFCPHCGVALAAGAPAREQRKTVTVVFCDITGSTELGGSTDPEALRALLARYFARMKEILEAHGGTVEKFIGDAVMAVFGVPHVHEDDALRAVRAAAEMRDALPELGIRARIGVNTGMVVTGTHERLATGDAVNVAARLEQAASTGEILIGEETLSLVRAFVEVEAVEALALKGKPDPVPAARLIRLTDGAERRHGVPMVGREMELNRLRATFEQAVRNRSCQLFTLLGAAGVGKSRLAHEFLDGIDATVVIGRCLSYGQGITYWPVVEVLRQLDALPSEPAAAAPLRSLLGEDGQEASAEAIAWGFRKLLEERAGERPVVCVFDDVHWGEVGFLELVEHIADLSRDAPILVLAMARPELLDARPGWGGGKLNATTVLLEPLSATETAALLDALGAADAALRGKVEQAAEGNPLFLEEMVALAGASTGDAVEVPATIQALLAARLDQLEPGERAVLECGSVEGRLFHAAAVQALAPDEQKLQERLVGLVRKELVRPHKEQLAGEDAFRFRHLLIREAAYEALPKATRADLHERLATWLAEHGRELVELNEIVAHHLEQAARYKAELGHPDADLAARAGARLAVGGRRALWRGDGHAAASLLGRALELTRPVAFDLHLELDFAQSLHWLDLEKAASVADDAAARAEADGDEAGRLLALTAAGFARAIHDPDPDIAELDRVARAALPLLEEAGDHAGLVHVWYAIGDGVENCRGGYETFVHASEEAIRHARLAGQRWAFLFDLVLALISGPCPADEALRRIDDALPEHPHPADLLLRSILVGMLGDLDDARSLAADANERLVEYRGFGGEHWLAEVAILAGDHKAAAAHLANACDLLEARGRRNNLSLYVGRLGRELHALGRLEDADELARRGRALAAPQDFSPQIAWREAQALVDSSYGRHASAEALAREAVAVAKTTDALNWQGEAWHDLGQVLAEAGRTSEAAQAFEQALGRFERKKNLAMVAQVRPRLAALV